MASKGTDPVIVFTCGRTGSTLLIRILNCLPNTIMWGEHGGVLSPVLRSYKWARQMAGNPYVTAASELLPAVINREEIRPRSGMSIEWLNWFAPDDIDKIYRNMIKTFFYPQHIKGKFSRWGFKEIRYRHFEYNVFRELFPGLKAIILFRNPAAVCASQLKSFAKGSTDKFPPLMKAIEEFYSFAAAEAMIDGSDASRPRPFFLSYEQLLQGFDDTTSALAGFLGEEFSERPLRHVKHDVERYIVRRDIVCPTDMDEVRKGLVELKELVKVGIPDSTVENIVEHYATLVKRSERGPF